MIIFIPYAIFSYILAIFKLAMRALLFLDLSFGYRMIHQIEISISISQVVGQVFYINTISFKQFDIPHAYLNTIKE